jgi:alpha-D-ribose 1-methylphosphonate 5-triphosphate synthase subunit PhnH
VSRVSGLGSPVTVTVTVTVFCLSLVKYLVPIWLNNVLKEKIKYTHTHTHTG